MATDGQRRRILDLEPSSLHQRTPLVVGSPHEVSLLSETIAADARRETARRAAPTVRCVPCGATTWRHEREHYGAAAHYFSVCGQLDSG